METYWHRLSRSLPQTVETRQLRKATGPRPAASSYHRLLELIPGRPAEGFALLNEGVRLWPEAKSLKAELAKMYIAQGDGARVAAILPLAVAQRDPTCGWLVMQGALLTTPLGVEKLRLLAPSLAIQKLDKSKAEGECLSHCLAERWQDAAILLRRHLGLAGGSSSGRIESPGDAPAERRGAAQEVANPRAGAVSDGADGPFAEFRGCFGADLEQLRDWLSHPEVASRGGAWYADQPPPGLRPPDYEKPPQPEPSLEREPLARKGGRKALVAKLLAAARPKESDT